MATEVKSPVFPESVADGVIVTWHKKEGEPVQQDENLVDIETDKVVLEVPAPQTGVLKQIVKQEGDTVESQVVLALIEASDVSASKVAPAQSMSSDKPSAIQEAASDDARVSPAARKLVAEHKLDVTSIPGSGKSGTITKEDVQKALTTPKEPPAGPATRAPSPASQTGEMPAGVRPEKRVPMTRLRARIAERLVEAQHTAAMLTTFNEVNLRAIKLLREQHKELFEKRHGIKLGFMSFFVKAVVEALKRFPEVNASIDGNDIVYHGYFDIGVAVSSPRGLVVPILRNTECMGIADIERAIHDFAVKAKEGKLSIDEMTGGTFTLSNGGVFGSLLSTPILNPPQSAILGMHAIQDRPVVINGEIVIRPMMNLALSYDHRIIDGREAVSFLVSIKQSLEDPARLLLDI